MTSEVNNPLLPGTVCPKRVRVGYSHHEHYSDISSRTLTTDYTDHTDWPEKRLLHICVIRAISGSFLGSVAVELILEAAITIAATRHKERRPP